MDGGVLGDVAEQEDLWFSHRSGVRCFLSYVAVNVRTARCLGVHIKQFPPQLFVRPPGWLDAGLPAMTSARNGGVRKLTHLSYRSCTLQGPRDGRNCTDGESLLHGESTCKMLLPVLTIATETSAVHLNF